MDLTTIERPWVFLDEETRSALKRAHEQGEAIEALRMSTADWFDVGDPSWLPGTVYRVRPTPKPPAIELPWEVIDPRWKWAAIDGDKTAYLYSGEIEPTPTHWVLVEEGDYRQIDDILTGIRINVTDWKLSLTKRPEV